MPLKHLERLYLLSTQFHYLLNRCNLSFIGTWEGTHAAFFYTIITKEALPMLVEAFSLWDRMKSEQKEVQDEKTI